MTGHTKWGVVPVEEGGSSVGWVRCRPGRADGVFTRRRNARQRGCRPGRADGVRASLV